MSGSSRPASLNVVGPEIEKANDRLVAGVSFYKPRSGNVAETDSDLKRILGEILNVEASIISELVSAYKSTELHGNDKQFNDLISDKCHFSVFLEKILQFYYDERLYLLHCVEFIISRGYGNHDYQDIFNGFLDIFDVNSKMCDSLVSQMQLLNNATPPKIGSSVSTAVIRQWWCSNLRERILVLQSLLYYSETAPLGANRFMDVLATCNGSGKQPSTRDSEVDSLFTSVLHLETVLLLKFLPLQVSAEGYVI